MNITTAAVFVAVGLLSLAGLTVSSRGSRAEGAWQVVMAAGMVSMILPADDPLPVWMWAACFCVSAAWAGTRLVLLGPVYDTTTDPLVWRRSAGSATHLLASSLAMMLMLALGHGEAPSRASGEGVHHHGQAALAGGESMLGTFAVLAGVAFLMIAAWTMARLPAVLRADHGVGLVDVLRSPAMAMGCSAAMGAGMGAMLLTMA